MHGLAPNIVALDIAPHCEFTWNAGQYVLLVREDGLAQPCSKTSVSDEDFFFTLHVRRIDGRAMSSWLCREVAQGLRLRIR